MAVRGKKIAVRRPPARPVAAETPRPRVREVPTPRPTVIEAPVVTKEATPSEVSGPTAETEPRARAGRSARLKELGVITH